MYSTSNSVADNNIVIYLIMMVSQIDKVGMGTADEAEEYANPDVGQSIEEKLVFLMI